MQITTFNPCERQRRTHVWTGVGSAWLPQSEHLIRLAANGRCWKWTHSCCLAFKSSRQVPALWNRHLAPRCTPLFHVLCPGASALSGTFLTARLWRIHESATVTAHELHLFISQLCHWIRYTSSKWLLRLSGKFVAEWSFFNVAFLRGIKTCVFVLSALATARPDL